MIHHNVNISTYQQECLNMLSHNLMKLTHFISYKYFIKHLQGNNSCNYIKCTNSSHNSKEKKISFWEQNVERTITSHGGPAVAPNRLNKDSTDVI